MARRRIPSDITRFEGARLPASDFQAVNDGLRIPYQVLELSLATARSYAAGTAAELVIAGNSFYADRKPDTGVYTVILQGPNRNSPPGRIYVEPGATFRIPFTRLIIENDAQPGKIVRIFYGVDIDFQPGTTALISVSGNVNVLEGGVERSMQGEAFWGGASITGAGGQFPHVQLWNPGASGVLLAVTRLTFGTLVAQPMSIARLAAPLATLIGVPSAKSLGATAPATTQLRGESNVAVLGTLIDSFYPAASAPLVLPFIEPIVLTPGWGLNINGHTVATSINATFDYFEAPFPWQGV